LVRATDLGRGWFGFGNLPEKWEVSADKSDVQYPPANFIRRQFMAVRRIVANIATDRLDAARAFYGDLLGMSVVMDLGWITTFAADGIMAPQISVATEGGSGTTVPDLSIEVDNLSDVHRRAQAAGLEIEYGPVAEPWGVTRFFVRDPFGRLVNILEHR